MIVLADFWIDVTPWIVGAFLVFAGVLAVAIAQMLALYVLQIIFERREARRERAREHCAIIQRQLDDKTLTDAIVRAVNDPIGRARR